MNTDNSALAKPTETGAITKAAPKPEAKLIDSLKNSTALKVAETLPDTAYVELLKVQRNLTIEAAATAPTIRQVTGFLGEKTVTKLICAVLKLFNDGLNISQQMSPKQLFEYTMLFCEEFSNETVKDLILCLKRTKAGRYNTIYNRIDGEVISKFFRAYLLEKAEWGEQQNRQYISDQIKAQNQLTDNLPPEQKAQIKKLLDKPRPRIIPTDSPVSNSKSYTEFLKKNAEVIPYEDLENVAARAHRNDQKEVLSIAVAELDRRKQAASETA